MYGVVPDRVSGSEDRTIYLFAVDLGAEKPGGSLSDSMSSLLVDIIAQNISAPKRPQPTPPA
ncbi:hypothetical protein An04g02960 [Aspergillus niger]|uniref:Uncharacterized protein n=2 Tax=Aspergillus niger TaxID=5061 RepID=A2QIB7_ASPNC|nr:hypothetical protein An04g02960 [Aspergillus niger]CAK96462.1 hypothetical protein An04g02960 [Aspergillus niger]